MEGGLERGWGEGGGRGGPAWLRRASWSHVSLGHPCVAARRPERGDNGQHAGGSQRSGESHTGLERGGWRPGSRPGRLGSRTGEARRAGQGPWGPLRGFERELGLRLWGREEAGGGCRHGREGDKVLGGQAPLPPRPPRRSVCPGEAQRAHGTVSCLRRTLLEQKGHAARQEGPGQGGVVAKGPQSRVSRAGPEQPVTG